MKHPIERPRTSLQIEEAIDLHITGWTVQRIGWILMLIFLLAAALGVFGDGILSTRTLSRDGITIVHDRFSRYQSDTEIEIETEGVKGAILVEVPAIFMDSYKIERIMPEPETRKIDNGDIEFTFPAHGQGKVTFFLSARKNGSFEYPFRINGTEFLLSNYIFP